MPGNLNRLSAELSVFIGRGGTLGGDSLKGLDSVVGAAEGESCSLDREYLRKCPPVLMRLGPKEVVVLVLFDLSL